jgi:acetylornithine deacetylase
MREYRLAARRLGDDRFAEAVVAREKGGDASRIVGLLVGREKKRRVAVRNRSGRKQARSRALDVAGTQADRTISGHASGAQALQASALHQAVRWGGQALDFVESQSHQRFGGLTGLRFNIGRVEGGIKANMIAPSAELRFGFSPLPSMSIEGVHERVATVAEAGVIERYEETFRGPSLPAGDVADAERRRLEARDLADALGLPIGNAVDFWTEASLFSAAGLTALVYGPGDIAQAHSADEWVALEQLATAATTYQQMLER